jgi:hypothetical protein
MNVIQEIQSIRSQIMLEVDEAFTTLIRKLERNTISVENLPVEDFETVYPITVNPAIFKGKKPNAVIFGNVRVTARTWKMVLKEILRRCNEEPEKHKALMSLRDKITGRERIILSARKTNMRSPFEIGTKLYIETHYDTETLMRILLSRVLSEINYDYSIISVAVRNAL